jgi:hypothetical protein
MLLALAVAAVVALAACVLAAVIISGRTARWWGE